jgi:hypothetical protein
LKESTRHVGVAPLELQYLKPGSENVVGAIGIIGGRQMGGKNFHSKCNGMRTWVHGMMRKWSWGPAASTLKDMPVRTQHIRF